MSVLVFGRTGQVARELAVFDDVVALGRDAADLADPIGCAGAIRARRPVAVINAAAYTAVDRAEEEEALATTINADAPKAMAEVCAELAIPFVQISTDYVFDGSGTQPWRAEDTPHPQNAYGRSKLAGERGVLAVGGNHAILRTAWVFSAHGSNFVKTMLRLSETRDSLNVVADQCGGPTPARAIARACHDIARQLRQTPSKSGIYHFSGVPDVSWADFARAIFADAGCRVTVAPIATAQYPTPAARPLNSRLDCHQTEVQFGISRPDWRAGLAEVLHAMEQQS